MTEGQWLASADRWLMLELVRSKASERQLRLFAAACFRRVTRLLPLPGQQAGIDVLELLADGGAPPQPRREIIAGVRRAIPPDERDTTGVGDHPHYVGLMLYREFVSRSTASHALHAADGVADPATERDEQVQLLRDIFGNAFRPVAVDPAWLTSTVVSLAGGIYAERAFDRLPILADALQDAGCDNADVLDHCRGPGPHVRGCLVVDLVLGKA